MGTYRRLAHLRRAAQSGQGACAGRIDLRRPVRNQGEGHVYGLSEMKLLNLILSSRAPYWVCCVVYGIVFVAAMMFPHPVWAGVVMCGGVLWLFFDMILR